MSTLNALAQKHGITVPLRVSDCPKVLTIVKIDNQQVPDGQGGTHRRRHPHRQGRERHGSTRCASTRSPSANWSASSGRTPRSKASGCSPARSTKGRQELHRFRPSRRQSTRPRNRVPARRRRGHGADQGHDAVRPQPRSPGRHRQPRTHHEDDVVQRRSNEDSESARVRSLAVRRRPHHETGQHLHRRISSPTIPAQADSPPSCRAENTLVRSRAVSPARPTTAWSCAPSSPASKRSRPRPRSRSTLIRSTPSALSPATRSTRTLT